MKKFLVFWTIFGLLLFFVSSAWAVPAGPPNTGTWTSPADFNIGKWTEYFVTNGNPGQIGNLLDANAYSTSTTNVHPMSWYIDDLVALSATPLGEPTSEGWMKYTTTYSGGTIVLKSVDSWASGDPWRNPSATGNKLYAFSIESMSVVAYIDPSTGKYAKLDNVQVPGELALSGVYIEDPLYTLSVEGLLSEGGFGTYPLPDGSGQNYLGHWGKIYDMTVTVASAPVPEPATMLLLGFGLIGLAGFGRKKLFNK